MLPVPLPGRQVQQQLLWIALRLSHGLYLRGVLLAVRHDSLPNLWVRQLHNPASGRKLPV